MHIQPALLVIGGGNMGRAIIAGALDAGALPDQRLVGVADPDAERRRALQDLGVEARASAAEGIAWLRGVEGKAGSGQVLLAVKPQTSAQVSGEIRALLVEPRIVITIMAGRSSQRVRAMLGDMARVVRAMPNLPVSVRRGMTALCLGAGAQPGDERFAARLFEAVGLVMRIDEGLMDAFTALAGSGPAYLFYLAEAMGEAAVRMGFTPEAADQVVRQTLLGAATLASGSADKPGALRAAVTSRGGTTGAAMDALECAAVKEAIIKAVVAARDRGAALASEA